MQDCFDVFQKQGFDIALFKIVGTVKDKRISLNVHGLQFVEPSGNGGFRQVAFQLLQYVFPYIGDRIQKDTPPCKQNETGSEKSKAF